MDVSRQTWEKLTQGRLVALLAPKSVEECIAAYEALDPVGVVLEIALRTDVALDGIRALRERHPQALVLAGTVLTRAQAVAALDAGVAGVVSADYIPAVVEECVRRDVMCIPGGIGDAGKQLVQKAELYGCSLEELRARHPHQWIYKLFPAMTGANLEMVKAWQAVYKGLAIVYTGGVTVDNVGRIAAADPAGIVCGSALTEHVGDPDRMVAEARRWLAIIHERTGVAPTGAVAPPAPCAPDGAVVTFGEVMLRLSPPHGERFRQTPALDARFGGAEANVAVSLAQFGREARFVSALPAHDIGQAAVDRLRALGVDTRFILRQGNRVGIYYLEHGAAQRPSRVIYDRAGSSISAVGPGQIDWTAVFAGASWFHWSGITPALSQSAAATTREAVTAAKAAGLTVSVDLNYRSKLWTRDEARAVMTPLMEHVDVVIGNESDVADVFGIVAGASDPERGKLDVEAYHDIARQMTERFGLRAMASTLRESRSASENNWSACLYAGGEFLVSRSYRILVVDRVGGGDAFSAGLIHGLLAGKDPRAALEFAVAASCLKHSVEGDFNVTSLAEVEALVGGDASGRVKR